MALSNKVIIEYLTYPKLKNFDVHNFCLDSHCLSGNPLGDSALRNNPLLSPKSPNSKNLGLVIFLAGFAGNGTKYLGDKGFEESLLQQIDRLYGAKQVPDAHFLFVDAWTFWGGSQFINSPAIGRYEDFVIKELYPALIEHLQVPKHKVAIVGHSSGGFGALHLASSHPNLFPYCIASAPDCYFEASLLPDLYKSAPFLNQNSKYEVLKDLHKQGKILKQKNGFSILNAIAMSACYGNSKLNKIEFPIDLKTGVLKKKIWQHWQTKDPVYFTRKRSRQIKKLKGLYLDVGSKDEFHLQFGVRQIHLSLKSLKISHHFSEFDGGHFDSHERYPIFWKWLQKKWEH